MQLDLLSVLLHITLYIRMHLLRTYVPVVIIPNLQTRIIKSIRVLNCFLSDDDNITDYSAFSSAGYYQNLN